MPTPEVKKITVGTNSNTDKKSVDSKQTKPIDNIWDGSQTDSLNDKYGDDLIICPRLPKGKGVSDADSSKNGGDKGKSTDSNSDGENTDYIVQNGETPKSIAKKLLASQGKEVDVKSDEFKKLVDDIKETNKDKLHNFGKIEDFYVGDTIKLPGKYDTSKLDMKSREEAIEDYKKEMANRRSSSKESGAGGAGSKNTSGAAKTEQAKVTKQFTKDGVIEKYYSNGVHERLFLTGGKQVISSDKDGNRVMKLYDKNSHLVSSTLYSKDGKKTITDNKVAKESTVNGVKEKYYANGEHERIFADGERQFIYTGETGVRTMDLYDKNGRKKVTTYFLGHGKTKVVNHAAPKEAEYTAGDKAGFVGKSALHSFTGLFTDKNGKFSLGKTALTVGGAIVIGAADVLTAGALTPVIATAGAAFLGYGAYETGKGIVHANKAKNNAEVKAAYEEIGGGLGDTALAAITYVKAPKALGFAEKAEGWTKLGTEAPKLAKYKEMTAYEKLAFNVKNTPKALKESFKAIADKETRVANYKAGKASIKESFQNGMSNIKERIAPSKYEKLVRSNGGKTITLKDAAGVPTEYYMEIKDKKVVELLTDKGAITDEAQINEILKLNGFKVKTPKVKNVVEPKAEVQSDAAPNEPKNAEPKAEVQNNAAPKNKPAEMNDEELQKAWHDPEYGHEGIDNFNKASRALQTEEKAGYEGANRIVSSLQQNSSKNIAEIIDGLKPGEKIPSAEVKPELAPKVEPKPKVSAEEETVKPSLRKRVTNGIKNRANNLKARIKNRVDKLRNSNKSNTAKITSPTPEATTSDSHIIRLNEAPKSGPRTPVDDKKTIKWEDAVKMQEQSNPINTETPSVQGTPTPEQAAAIKKNKEEALYLKDQ